MSKIQSKTVPEKPIPARDVFSERVAESFDLRLLVGFLADNLPGIPEPCSCVTGDCRRCQVEEIVARRTQ
jgi:hypothetical protein